MRIFAFGCSLTQYFYPTWADILIHQYKLKGYEGSNWAKSGAGNMYINMRLWEANTIHKFTKDDIILLQWSSMFREDRYHMGHGWWTPGNFGRMTVTDDHAFVLNNFRYESAWIWADIMHCTMRDCALISATHKALENIGCKVISTSFRDPFEGWEDAPKHFNQHNPKLELEDVGAVLESYKQDIATSCPPILNALNFGTTQEFFDTRPKSIPSRKEKDAHMLLPELHPLTHEAADFINEYIEKLSPETEDFVADWKEQLTNKDPIYLEDLKWFNSEKIGWSDDRWRP
tara:strand:- start:3098 stop:3961 length:864 start_codon:yes stop_codon:yes gene_type:complete